MSVCAHTLSCVRLFVMLWIVACQAPLLTEFPSQHPAGESKIIDIAKEVSTFIFINLQPGDGSVSTVFACR